MLETHRCRHVVGWLEGYESSGFGVDSDGDSKLSYHSGLGCRTSPLVLRIDLVETRRCRYVGGLESTRGVGLEWVLDYEAFGVPRLIRQSYRLRNRLSYYSV